MARVSSNNPAIKAALNVLTKRDKGKNGGENSFVTIASFWAAYLGITLTDHQVADMMILLKVARKKNRKAYRMDDDVDIIGYADWSAKMHETIPDGIGLENLDSSGVAS